MKNILRNAAATVLLVALTAPAYAHHPMDGAMPSTLWEGLASGVGHPVIGLDHLAFIVVAGLIAGVAGLGIFAPVAFVAASIAGVGLHLALVDLPAVELIIALSVVIVGGLVALGRSGGGAAVWMAGFALAGIFHGYAYGEAVVGAEPTPIVAYLVGLALVQAAIAVAVAKLAASQAWLPQSVQPRLVGAAVFGVGLSAVVGQVVG
ncbi:MAG: HupE/UreJ family protein [Mesorhizobium sp.]|nr:HupE/UreJ family protein [Mesorhizobium sp.]